MLSYTSVQFHHTFIIMSLVNEVLCRSVVLWQDAPTTIALNVDLNDQICIVAFLPSTERDVDTTVLYSWNSRPT